MPFVFLRLRTRGRSGCGNADAKQSAAKPNTFWIGDYALATGVFADARHGLHGRLRSSNTMGSFGYTNFPTTGASGQNRTEYEVKGAKADCWGVIGRFRLRVNDH